jgi:hypothetical protein
MTNMRFIIYIIEWCGYIELRHENSSKLPTIIVMGILEMGYKGVPFIQKLGFWQPRSSLPLEIKNAESSWLEFKLFFSEKYRNVVSEKRMVD